jgi:epoxyqueuosine reductase
MAQLSPKNLEQLAQNIKEWGQALGFQQIGICDTDISQHEQYLQAWLDKGYHGTMSYMENHGMKRARPDELVPGTIRVISVRMDYLPPDAQFAGNLKHTQNAYISRYALGRDYHKLVRKRLKQLAQKIEQHCDSLQFRPFVDSAPVLEHALAQKAGIGWTGKHSLTLNREAGSWFFLGELFINLPLPIDQPAEDHCGSCTACITICPTQAIVAPYQVDARRCISYLTIELEGAIPEEYRSLIGNRVYGCDDCQLICPWNRFAHLTQESDFHSRPWLKDQSLLTLIAWDEATFLEKTEGSAIRRIGYEKWQRNLAVGIGNAPFDPRNIEALERQKSKVSDMVKEHIDWAITQQRNKQQQIDVVVLERQTLRLTRSIEKGLPRDA